MIDKKLEVGAKIIIIKKIKQNNHSNRVVDASHLVPSYDEESTQGLIPDSKTLNILQETTQGCGWRLLEIQ